MAKQSANTPLSDLKAVVSASGVAAACAGRLLRVLGAETILLEPPEGTLLRREPPFLDPDGNTSALFAYLAAGARSLVCDLNTENGKAALNKLLGEADVLIDDTPLEQRERLGIDRAAIASHHPHLVHVSVLPFGASGPKAHWKGEEINLLHAACEGHLMPNGLARELFPDRPPVKIYGHFASLQGGIAAALGALSALWSRETAGGQFVDISSQDAMLAVGAFAVQRFGDGAIENRASRSFRYGGVLQCADGYVELLTLEQHQWKSLVKLMGNPRWAQDPALEDSVERGHRGAAINAHIREWAQHQRVEDLVAGGQKLGVPIAKYSDAEEVLADSHERVRGLFAPIRIDGIGACDMLISPFHFAGKPLSIDHGPPSLGDYRIEAPAESARGRSW
jgi:crotonobetainyl-CoA:carnitine CoA-transferase CaiB-like acyl-CoA transferase